MTEYKILVCDCSSIEHQLVFNYDKDDNTCYVSIHLNKLGFWKRLIHGIRYIFGYECKYGDFEEIILNEQHAEYLAELSRQLSHEK